MSTWMATTRVKLCLFKMMLSGMHSLPLAAHRCALQRKDMVAKHQFALHFIRDSTVMPDYLPQSEHPPETTTSRPGTNAAPEARTTLLKARQYMRVMPRARHALQRYHVLVQAFHSSHHSFAQVWAILAELLPMYMTGLQGTNQHSNAGYLG